MWHENFIITLSITIFIVIFNEQYISFTTQIPVPNRVDAAHRVHASIYTLQLFFMRSNKVSVFTNSYPESIVQYY